MLVLATKSKLLSALRLPLPPDSPGYAAPFGVATLLSLSRLFIIRLGVLGTIRVCRRSGNGGPQTCLPAACGVARGVAQYVPSSSTHAQDPREGPSLARRTMQDLLRGGLTRLAREGRSDQGKARSPEASGKAFHIGVTRPRPAGRQDEGHRGAQDGVTTSAFDR